MIGPDALIGDYSANPAESPFVFIGLPLFTPKAPEKLIAA
jgi:hypothetical protein